MLVQVDAVKQNWKCYGALLLRVVIKVKDYDAYVQLEIRVKR
jgi:hypothetical protein